jgi:hypothetical protein
MSDFDRQRELETDAVRNGCMRWCKSLDYQLATDARPVGDLLANSLQSLADAIHAEQDALKAGVAKLPVYGLPLLSLSPEQFALITIAGLLNGIRKSEFDEGVHPGLTSVAYEIGQHCRQEREYDLRCGRAIRGLHSGSRG